MKYTDDPKENLDKLSWRLLFHPLNDFELSADENRELRQKYLSLIRVEQKYNYNSKYFVCPIEPNEFFERERNGRLTDWHTEFRPPRRDFLEETKEGWEEVGRVLKKVHVDMLGAAKLDKRLGRNGDVKKLVESGVMDIVREAGVVCERVDPYEFPSQFCHLYAMLEKYYHKKTEKNDPLDAYLFIELPYVDVFVADKNNAEIAKKIQNAFDKRNAVFRPKICRCSVFEQWCKNGGRLTFI